MVSYLKAGLLTVVALVALVFALNVSVRAEDKKSKCQLCDEVKVVLESCRCEKCKPDKQCEGCAAKVKEAEKKYACTKCADKSCADCDTALKANKCKFCAAKTYIVTHTYCSANCEKAGNEKAEKCSHCAESRKMFVDMKCPDKNCPSNKK